MGESFRVIKKHYSPMPCIHHLFDIPVLSPDYCCSWLLMLAPDYEPFVSTRLEDDAAYSLETILLAIMKNGRIGNSNSCYINYDNNTSDALWSGQTCLSFSCVFFHNQSVNKQQAILCLNKVLKLSKFYKRKKKTVVGEMRYQTVWWWNIVSCMITKLITSCLSTVLK